jgi:hypothetical protein
MNTMDKNDEFLRNFFQKTGQQELSPGFSERVMEKIRSGLKMKPAHSGIFHSFGYLHIAVLSGLAALAYSIYYFTQINVEATARELDPLIIPVLKRIFLSFKEMVPAFKISSFTMVIFFAVFGVFIIDFLISRFKTWNNKISVL